MLNEPKFTNNLTNDSGFFNNFGVVCFAIRKLSPIKTTFHEAGQINGFHENVHSIYLIKYFTKNYELLQN